MLLTNSLPFVNVGALAALSSPQSKVIKYIFSAVVVRQFIIRHFRIIADLKHSTALRATGRLE